MSKEQEIVRVERERVKREHENTKILISCAILLLMGLILFGITRLIVYISQDVFVVSLFSRLSFTFKVASVAGFIGVVVSSIMLLINKLRNKK